MRAKHSLLLLAVILTAFCARPSSPRSGDLGQASRLPNDCAIVATEAATRLAATGNWARIIFVQCKSTLTGNIYGHALVVWTPPTATIVCIYDANGTLDLDTTSHEAAVIGEEYAKKLGAILLSAHFLK